MTLIQSFSRRQLRKFAKFFTSEIKSHFGEKPPYSASEIEEVAASNGISSKEREWAYDSYSAIIAAALELGCETVYSEDLNHGQLYAGVRVVNPFL